MERKMRCSICDDTGWVCERHQGLPFGHDPDCPGPGEPCSRGCELTNPTPFNCECHAGEDE